MSEKDIVEEARELLANAANGPLELIRYEHGGGRFIRDVDDNGQIQRDLIADFYDAGNRELYYRAPELLRALADEVERLRMAVSHAVRRNHDYAPASCDGCADAERALTNERGNQPCQTLTKN